jgi:hypothetical protein
MQPVQLVQQLRWWCPLLQEPDASQLTEAVGRLEACLSTAAAGEPFVGPDAADAIDVPSDGWPLSEEGLLLPKNENTVWRQRPGSRCSSGAHAPQALWAPPVLVVRVPHLQRRQRGGRAHGALLRLQAGALLRPRLPGGALEGRPQAGVQQAGRRREQQQRQQGSSSHEQ